MALGDDLPSLRCAVCGSVNTLQRACHDRTDAHKARYSAEHQHYQCSDCDYTGTATPTKEEYASANRKAEERLAAINPGPQVQPVPVDSAPLTGVDNSSQSSQ